VIWDLDTRALVRHLRTVGALRGVVSTDGTPAEKLIAEARALPTMAGQELAGRVTCEKRYSWTQASIALAAPIAVAASAISSGGRSFSSDIQPHGKKGASAPEGKSAYRVIAYDFGIKQNILRLLVDHGCDVTVVPAQTSAEDVLALKPHGVFLSNGPGDPEPIGYAIANIRKLLGRVPIFGICLGHQLCGLALGGKTFKLKFGHHGSNHPVKNLLTEKVEITAQNHGFCVDPESLPSSDVQITHVNLNDHTNEGMRHRSMPLFSVQYHPEASPGPHDARYLFNDFIALMTEHGHAG
jgi:carbamoyl-phosphate synthase small subunit